MGAEEIMMREMHDPDPFRFVLTCLHASFNRVGNHASIAPLYSREHPHTVPRPVGFLSKDMKQGRREKREE